MSNVSTGSGQTPPPVRFPDTAGKPAQRLGAGAVTLVIGVVIVIAAVVVAVIVFRGGSERPVPTEPTLPSQILNPTPKPQPESNPHGTRVGAAPLDYHSTVAKPTAPAPLSTGDNVVDIGDGLSMTLAKGWVVVDKGDHYAILLSPDNSSELVVTSGKTGGNDVMSVLGADINHLVNSRNSPLSNVTVGHPQQQPPPSRNFQQLAAVDYSGDLSIQQGTVRIYGLFAELMNTKTGESVFFDMHTMNPDALDAATTDTAQMVRSLF